MAVLKCKMCGGTLNASDNVNVCICEYCGTAQTITKTRDEINTNLFNRANNLRINRDFDKAQEIYERIVQDNPDDSEAYWGLVLCKYGIEYVTDPATGKKLPTCHRTQMESVLADIDYKSAISYAEQARRNLYISEAEEIDRIQRKILDIVRNEKGFDVFICYKQTDENGRRTPDSVIANDIYHQLEQAGIKAFFAAITLEDKLGQEYEPYIYSALSSARVMLVVGTKPEYFQSVWLKNEWSRFLKFAQNDKNRLLIPCYKDMDPYDLPEEFAHFQAQDMSKIGFINDVIRGVRKVVGNSAEASYAQASKSHDSNDSTIDERKMLQRISILFNASDFEGVEEYCDRLLDRDPDYPKAYYYKFLAEHYCHDLQELYSPQKVSVLADYYIKGYGYDVSDDQLYRKRVQYVLKHSIKNAMAFSRGAEHEEYVHAYEGIVSLIRNAVKEKESVRMASERIIRFHFDESIEKHSNAKKKVMLIFFIFFMLFFFLPFFIGVLSVFGNVSGILPVFFIVFVVAIIIIMGIKK
ncbi:MAG: toll/interleukin-1 receptor domain-containing protein [Ruminococcus sp.]|nr:toll/interleukin-1 receptor domain-containing protein [Ruminococcus sp.]